MTACVTPPSTGSFFNGNVSATFHFMQGKFQGYKCHTFKYLCHDVPYRKQKRLCLVVFYVLMFASQYSETQFTPTRILLSPKTYK